MTAPPNPGLFTKPRIVNTPSMPGSDCLATSYGRFDPVAFQACKQVPSPGTLPGASCR